MAHFFLKKKNDQLVVFGLKKIKSVSFGQNRFPSSIENNFTQIEHKLSKKGTH